MILIFNLTGAVIAPITGIAFAQMSSMNSSSSSTSTATNSTETVNLLQSSNSTTTNSSSAQTRTITHAMGETEITGTPERVVALEWNYAEYLLALGVKPVGSAEIESMHEWVNLKNNSFEGVVDIGGRVEPNLEVVTQLEPDLIIGEVGFNGEYYEQLNAIAPTLLFNHYPNPAEENVTGLERMEEELVAIGEVLNRQDEAVKALERMNATIEGAKATVEGGELASNPFVLVQAWMFEGDVTMRIFTDNSQPIEIMQRMGMENAWDAEFTSDGFTDISLEQLTPVQNANFFYVSGAESEDIFEETFRNNPVWNNLNFVREGRVYELEPDTWPFGGPISAEVIAERVAAAAVAGEQQQQSMTMSSAANQTSPIS
jgi:ferric hydroxamate transport system substrate-binding protein